MLQQQQLMAQQQQQQQQLFAQPTGYGSNNPFAPQQPQTSLLDPQPSSQQSFNPMSSFSQPSTSQPTKPSLSPPISPTPASAPKPAWQAPQQKKDDGEHAGLANLLARGREDGLDTFGNVGNLREYQRAYISAGGGTKSDRRSDCDNAKVVVSSCAAECSARVVFQQFGFLTLLLRACVDCPAYI